MSSKKDGIVWSNIELNPFGSKVILYRSKRKSKVITLIVLTIDFLSFSRNTKGHLLLNLKRKILIFQNQFRGVKKTKLQKKNKSITQNKMILMEISVNMSVLKYWSNLQNAVLEWSQLENWTKMKEVLDQKCNVMYSCNKCFS